MKGNGEVINVIQKEIQIGSELKRKIEFICEFCNTHPRIINGSIRTIEHTNINYIEPHKIIIKGTTFLAFDNDQNIYINNLSKSISINKLEEYLKQK